MITLLSYLLVNGKVTCSLIPTSIIQIQSVAVVIRLWRVCDILNFTTIDSLGILHMLNKFAHVGTRPIREKK
jgi:hypothetical protein